jgi:putative ABC transport system substrate-binding protein
MTAKMQRRAFITLLGGAAAAWPLAARTQQPAMPVIGFLNSGTPDGFARMLVAFHKGLNETGYVEGRNAIVEYRWAENQYDRLPALAAELVRRPVDVIAATGGITSALARGQPRRSRSSSRSTAIRSSSGSFRASIGRMPTSPASCCSSACSARNGSNCCASWCRVPVWSPCWQTRPKPHDTRAETRDVQDAARALGQQTIVLNANVDSEIDEAFATLVRQGASALVVLADPFFVSRRDKFAAQAARYAVPTIYPLREFVAAGGLISYGTSITDVFRQTGVYTGRILRGGEAG